MADKPPQPTDRIIKRLRRHARACEQAILQHDTANREGKSLTREVMGAIRNTNWQAAGRIEDLKEARRLLAHLAGRSDIDVPEHVVRFIERTEGWD